MRHVFFISKCFLKAYFRGAKAAVALESFEEAAELCTAGIEYDRTNMELLELKKIIDKKLSDGDGAISSWAITFMNVNCIFTNITIITTFMVVDLFIAILILQTTKIKIIKRAIIYINYTRSLDVVIKKHVITLLIIHV